MVQYFDMKIAIIGGGFTGLSAAYKLSKLGHTVTVFERESFLGGLAYGFKEKEWDWHLEAAYHHLFTNDNHILDLLSEIGIGDAAITKRPVTATLWRDRMYQLDSPLSLLKFPGLGLIDKIRTAFVLGLLKFTPVWKPLESFTAEHMMKSAGGHGAWQVLWEPLLYGKFGTLAPTVSAAWLWARIKKRTPSLVYIKGGFHTIVQTLEEQIKKNGGTIHLSTTIDSIAKKNNGFLVTRQKKSEQFDTVLLTTPTPIATRLFPDLPSSYTKELLTIPHLFAQTLIVETDRPLLPKVYWLNVTDRSFPFLAAVAHTNFMDPKHYGGHHLAYFGNYLPHSHPYISMTKEQLLKTFKPFIDRLAKGTKYKIHNSFMFVGPFAQPVHGIKYSKKIPPITTPIPGMFMANMDYVVPWDRGTNYAVELGLRAAQIIHETR
jgi:protoporphyrinogen oxidase